MRVTWEGGNRTPSLRAHALTKGNIQFEKKIFDPKCQSAPDLGSHKGPCSLLICMGYGFGAIYMYSAKLILCLPSGLMGPLDANRTLGPLPSVPWASLEHCSMWVALGPHRAIPLMLTGATGPCRMGKRQFLLVSKRNTIHENRALAIPLGLQEDWGQRDSGPCGNWRLPLVPRFNESNFKRTLKSNISA